jgi:hypothetical protein
MGLEEKEKLDLLRIVASILHLGNISVTDYRDRADIRDFAAVERVSHLLGISSEEFKKSLLAPRIKAGRDWVTQAKSPAQVVASLDALAKTLYERNFAFLVERINKAIDGHKSKDKLGFIGVLDIAGFEIFEVNSFIVLIEDANYFYSLIVLNNFVSTIPTRNFSNSLIKTCLNWSKRNTRKKRLIGIILTLERIFSLLLISSKRPM